MGLRLEWRKRRRTGLFPGFISGGILAGAVPVANMFFRSQQYVNAVGEPFAILSGANWQLMSMLNLFLVVTGSCILYHVEHTENALQKMETLPVSLFGMYVGKAVLLIVFSLFALLVEAAALGFCCVHWFSVPADVFLLKQLSLFVGREVVFLLPTQLIMLAAASVCSSLWVSLGIGVLGMFAASVVTMTGSLGILAHLPFAMPYENGAVTAEAQFLSYLISAGLQSLGILTAEAVYWKIGRRLR